MAVEYAIETNFSIDEFIDVLVRSTLAERRPVQDRAVIEGMLRNADVIVTARVDGLLVGVSRAIADFSFCTYLTDLAVDEKFQGQGIRQRVDPPHSRGDGIPYNFDPARGSKGDDVLPSHRHDQA